MESMIWFKEKASLRNLTNFRLQSNVVTLEKKDLFIFYLKLLTPMSIIGLRESTPNFAIIFLCFQFGELCYSVPSHYFSILNHHFIASAPFQTSSRCSMVLELLLTMRLFSWVTQAKQLNPHFYFWFLINFGLFLKAFAQVCSLKLSVFFPNYWYSFFKISAICEAESSMFRIIRFRHLPLPGSRL